MYKNMSNFTSLNIFVQFYSLFFIVRTSTMGPCVDTHSLSLVGISPLLE